MMEISDFFKKAQEKLEARKRDLEQLEKEMSAYVVKQAQAKFPNAIFCNGHLSEKMPIHIVEQVRQFMDHNFYTSNEGSIGSYPDYRKMLSRKAAIKKEINVVESYLADSSADKFADARNWLTDKLLLKEDLLRQLKTLQKQINFIDSQIESARSDYSRYVDLHNDLKEFIG